MSRVPAIGIDLGTTFSCVGVFIHSRVEIIANEQGNRTTASYVAFNDTERLVGDPAKDQAAINPQNTVYDAKRLIGRKFNDPAVEKDSKLWPFQLVNENGKPKIKVQFKGEEKSYYPEQISSMVLAKMKETAEAFLSGQVRNAVITVPAYFNDSQRQATKDAGQIAGLNVLRIINEPTAAAIAYGLDKVKDGKERKILIFDLGGGTFDVSILTLADGVFQVKATAGNTHLGGQDFDNRLINYFLNDFARKTHKNPKDNKKAIRRLRTAVERAKRTLSSTTQATIEIEAFHDGLDLQSILTRARFEDLCNDLFQSTLEPVKKALNDANCSKNDVDEVIIVGGSTRIPKIQRILSSFFEGKELNRSIHPDEAIAYGAAVQAAILSGDDSRSIQDILLIDVAPLSLGLETTGGIMNVIVPRNSPIPIRKTQFFTTAVDRQKVVLVQVFEGERKLTKYNNLLGKFELTNLPSIGRGQPKIEVVFDMDTNGILNVSATEVASGTSNKITIFNDKGRLTREQIDRMVYEASHFKKQDQVIKSTALSRNQLENYVFTMKDLLDNKEAVSKLSESERDGGRTACSFVVKWLDENPNADKREYDQKTQLLESVYRPLAWKISTNSSCYSTPKTSSSSSRSSREV